MILPNMCYRRTGGVDNNFNLNKRVFWSYGTSRSKGVCIMISNPKIKISKFHSDYEGRIIYVDFTLNNDIFYRLINIYTPTNTVDRNIFFTEIIPHLVVAKNLILAGDHNFIFNTNLDKIGGNPELGTVGSKTFQKIIDIHKLIDCFRYKYPKIKKITWKRSLSTEKTNKYDFIGTRIDRFYINSSFKNSIIDCNMIHCSHSDHEFLLI